MAMPKAIREREGRLTAAGLAWLLAAGLAGGATGSLATPWLIARAPTEPPWMVPAVVSGGLALGVLAALLVPPAIRAVRAAKTKSEPARRHV
jgi:hypothetical protein